MKVLEEFEAEGGIEGGLLLLAGRGFFLEGWARSRAIAISRMEERSREAVEGGSGVSGEVGVRQRLHARHG